MKSQPQLVLEYETVVIDIAIGKLAELTRVKREDLNAAQNPLIQNSRATITFADYRDNAGLKGKLSEEEIDDLMSILGTKGYQIPQGASEGLVDAMRSKLDPRVRHYQHLLDTSGSFVGWKGLLQERYSSGGDYIRSVEPINEADRNLFRYENETLSLMKFPKKVIATRPMSQMSNSVLFARRQIATIGFE